MSTAPTSGIANRLVRTLLVLVGGLLIAYAGSDHPLYGGEPGFGQTQWAIAAAGAGLALCALLPLRFGGAVLLIVTSCLLMLALAETAAEFVLGPKLRPIFQPDERLIFKFIPNRTSTMTRSPVNGGETVTHRINAQGFRGTELLPPGGAPRIAVYGDSFIHAIYTRDEETFTQQLGGYLATAFGTPVEAVNAGVSSYGPDQIALKMEDELPRLRPALAVVAIFAGNDYGDLMRNKLFRLGPDGTLVANRWTLDPKVRIWFDLGQRESILKRAFRNVSGSLRASTGGAGGSDLTDVEFLRRQAESEYRDFVVDGNNVVTNTHIDYYSGDISLTPDSASARHKVALMTAVIRKIRDVAAKNGVPLVLLLIPHPVDVTNTYDGWRIPRDRYPGYDGRNQIAPLERIAKDLQLPYLSLYDLYRSRDANTLYFHGGDDHWNAAGQRIAAEAMAAHVVAHRLLPIKGSSGDPPARK